MADDQQERPNSRNTYREGGAPKGGRSSTGPGSRDRADMGARPDNTMTDSSSEGGERAAENKAGAPGEPPGRGHATTGTPSPDLGRGWGQAPAPRPGSSPSMAAPASGSYEGWSGRTGQDYHPDGRQSFEQPTGPWARGGAEPGPATADWHAEHSDGRAPPAAGDPENFRGEAAYNQSFREPYGAYQGGYPGEAPLSDHMSEAYAHWRAEQLKKIDADYAAWCQARQAEFERDFEAWRRDREKRSEPAKD